MERSWSSMMIDPTAIVHEDTKIADDVSIGAYSIIEPGVIINKGCKIAAHVIIRKGTVLEENVEIDSFSVIGGLPQNVNKGFDPDTKSGVLIKKGTVIREYVTVNRSTFEGQDTEIGENCFLMGSSHVAHDCKLGNNVVLTNGVLIAGLTKVGAYTNIGGGAALHQQLNVGEGVMIGGHSSISLDIPPFLMVSDRNQVRGLNLVGIKRRGFGQKDIGDLKACFGEIFYNPGNPYVNAQQAKDQCLGTTTLGETFLRFFENKGCKGCVQSRQLARKPEGLLA